MKIRAYNMVLERLKQEQIEMLRQWRNSEEIKKYMAFREEISPEMQANWFHSINNKNNHYFIIHLDEQPVGLINGKDANYEDKSVEGGIFLVEKKYWETLLPASVSVSFTDFGFDLLGFEKIYAHILKDNQRAISYNHQLGFELCEGEAENYNQLYVLTKERYQEKIKNIRQSLGLVLKNKHYQIIIEPIDFELGIAAPLIENYENSSPAIKELYELEILPR